MIVAAAVLVLAPMPASAYVDPGTGGALVQYLTAGILGAAVLLKLCWRRITEALAGRLRPSADDDKT
jgi:hypothetical protein